MKPQKNAILSPTMFTLPKIDENPNLNEDACRCEPRRGLMAIADGMSNSSHPRQWANLLAKGFISCEKQKVCEYIAKNWVEWLNPLQEKFYQYCLKILQQPVDTKDLIWNPALAGIHNRGTSATFVGLQIFPIDKETNKGKWQAVALIAGTPTTRSARKIIKPPPPATEFNTPLIQAAKKRKQACIKLILYRFTLKLEHGGQVGE